MPIRDLKFVYMTFDGDYNGTREFLIVSLPPSSATTTAPAPSQQNSSPFPDRTLCLRRQGCTRAG